MNRTTKSTRWMLCLLVALVLVFAVSGPASAAGVPGLAADASVPLFGSFLQDVVGNRTRMMQVSVVFVLVGIALLFKK